MSILDGIFSNRETLEGGLLIAQKAIAETKDGFDPKLRELLDATLDGTSVGDALGVTKEQKASLLELGCRLLQVGETLKGIDVLLRLSIYDPLEERAYYALGVACQTQGELHRAAQMYLQFLALDATNPLGYLRLGECLIAAGEHDEAVAVLQSAAQFADDAGDGALLSEARALLSRPELRAAGAAAGT